MLLAITQFVITTAKRLTLIASRIVSRYLHYAVQFLLCVFTQARVDDTNARESVFSLR